MWKRFNVSGIVANKKRYGGSRNPVAKLGTKEHEDFVNKWMRDVPDLSAKQLSLKSLKNLG